MRDLFVEMVETESMDEADRDRVCPLGKGDEGELWDGFRFSSSLFALDCASCSSAMPLL